MEEIEKESVKVLRECIDLQLKKSQDYQSSASNVTQAMHYRRGIETIHDIMQSKLYRAESLLDSAKAGQDGPNFESIEDSYKDLINYASFAVSWLRGKMEGQNVQNDIFNRPIRVDGYSGAVANSTPIDPPVQVKVGDLAVDQSGKLTHFTTGQVFSDSYCRTDSDVYTGHPIGGHMV